MATKQRVKKPATVTEFGRLLMDSGFRVTKKSQGDKPAVLELGRDSLTVRLGTKEQPWPTVYEKTQGGNTDWYLDLPMTLSDDRKLLVILALLAN